MELCMNCGRPRTRAALRTRCVCIPDAVWREKEMITALERLDVITVVRLLYRHLSQTELSRMVDRSQSTVSDWISGKAGKRSFPAKTALAIFERLGAPDDSFYSLDEVLAAWEHTRVLTVTAPEALQVRVGDRATPVKEPIGFLARGEHGLVLTLEAGTAWIADTHHNMSTVRIDLEDSPHLSPEPDSEER